ncbi:MAG: methyltransferase [Arcobacteraceae bacterium]|nr:methyltransferase [Arcobacteraceae bacterium]
MVLYQPQNGYCYNSDTLFLYDFILQNLQKYKNPNGDLLDIGSGSGILGLLIAKSISDFKLHQVEIQDDFCFLSSKNAYTNKIDAILFEGDFLELDFDKKFDYIVSNPPFYHHASIKSENNSLKIARYNTNFSLDNFIQKVSKTLKPKGSLFFCYDVKQINDIITTLSKYKFNLEAIRFVHPNKNKDASLVLIYAKKSSSSLLKVYPPFIVHKDDGYTKEAIELFIKANTHSIKVEI